MPAHLKHICLLVAGLVLFAPAAWTEDSKPAQDKITFRNDDVLTGTIVGATSQSLTFLNKTTGQFTAPWEQIRSVAVGQPLVLKAAGSCTACAPQTNLSGSTVQVAEQTLVIGGGARSGTSSTIPLSAIASIDTEKPAQTCAGPVVACPGVHLGTVSVSVNVMSSTQKAESYGGNLVLVGNWRPRNDGWPHQRTRLELVSTYDEKRKNNLPGSASITHVHNALAKHQFFTTSDKVYTFVLADLYHNNSLGLYFDQAYGGGAGVLWKGLQLEADLRFLRERFYLPTPTVDLVGSAFSERYMFRLPFIRKDATLSETAVVMPVFNVSKAWRLQGLLDLVIPITNTIGLKTLVTDNYVENAPPGFRKNYVKTSIGFQYSPRRP